MGIFLIENTAISGLFETFPTPYYEKFGVHPTVCCPGNKDEKIEDDEDYDPEYFDEDYTFEYGDDFEPQIPKVILFVRFVRSV